MKTFILFCLALTFFMLGFVAGVFYDDQQNPDIIAQLAEIQISQ